MKSILPDASAHLLYTPSAMDPTSPTGLWLCLDLADMAEIVTNAAALPMGATTEDLIAATDFFEAFNCVLVVGTDEEYRATVADILRKYLPSVEVCVTTQDAYRGCSSLHELKEQHGQSAVDDLWMYADELPPAGLVEISGVERVDIARQPKARSGIPGLDQLIGGLYDGELTVWTGKRKEGKSTLLGLPILAAIREGRTVCVYSGELPDWRYKAWLLAMAAGPRYLMEQVTDTGKTVWVPTPEVARQIEAWWQGKLYLLDNRLADVHDPDRIVSLLRYAKKRYGASMFVVDNLMTVDLTGEDFYRSQSRFVGKLVDLAHTTGAHVHLVAHRRKGGADRKSRGDSDDVSGSAEITNRADNTFGVSRMDENEDFPYDAKLEILANRDFGASGSIGLNFDPKSRRYYLGDPNWQCGWEQSSVETQQMVFTELTGGDKDLPF